VAGKTRGQKQIGLLPPKNIGYGKTVVENPKFKGKTLFGENVAAKLTF